VNVAWALVNVVVGYLLFRAGHVCSGTPALVVFFAGIAVISLWMSVEFQGKHAR
jgi:hypothetical protein